MSATSITNGFIVPALSPRDAREAGGHRVDDDGTARRGQSLLEKLLLAGWRKQIVETLVFLAVIAVLQRRLFGAAEIPGVPHPYWLPVLLASCQYGVRGGTIAAVAASAVYLSELSPASAAQDFYAYAATVAVQPGVWLATALVLGGLRNLHIHQYAQLTDQFAVCRRRATDLSNGLEQAVTEINALERRIALDASSVAAFSRSLSLIDMSDRRTAAMSLGELFRVGTGARKFIVYLRDPEGYAPVWAVEEGVPLSTKSLEPLPPTAIKSILTASARPAKTDEVGGARSGAGRYVVAVPSSGFGSEPLAAIVCELQTSQDLKQFYRRAEDLGRLFATILHASPNPPSVLGS
jgi:hypothetical protein